MLYWYSAIDTIIQFFFILGPVALLHPKNLLIVTQLGLSRTSFIPYFQGCKVGVEVRLSVPSFPSINKEIPCNLRQV